MTKIALLDSVILIELYKINLIGKCLKLDYRYCITNMIFADLHKHQQKELFTYINDGSLEIIKVTSEDLLTISQDSSLSHKLTFQNILSLHLLKKLNAVFITSDTWLEKIAKDHSIETIGLLCIFDQLVNNNIISPADAAVHMEALLQQNKRLPLNECHERIKKWKAE